MQELSFSRGMADHTIVMHVRPNREWRWRIRLSVWLMHLAASVLGTGFRVETETDA